MRVLLPVALAALVLAACQETEPAPAATVAAVSTPQPPTPTLSAATPAPTASATAAAPAAPASAEGLGPRGGRLTIATRVALEDLDVHRSASPSLAAFGPGIVYSRLLRFTSGPGVETPSLALECDLCASWAWEGAATLRVMLRPGVRWQSAAPVNGRLLSPHDVTASLARQQTAGWPHAGLLANIASAQVQGNGIVFTLRAPDADFPLALADGHTKVLPAELAGMATLGEGPFIGTGPWVAEEVDAGRRFRFSANPAYFEPGLPRVEGLDIRVMADPAIRNAAFLTKSLDVDEVAPEELAAFRRRNPDAGVLRYAPPGGGAEFALNVNAPALREAGVRRALFRALDPWSLNRQVWHGLADVTGGMPAASPRWRPTEEELREGLADPVGAREMLSASGSAPETLELIVGDFGDPYLVYSQGIQEHLRAVGVRVRVEALSPPDYVERVWRKGDFQAYLGPLPPLSAPNDYLVGMVRSGAAGNRTGFGAAALDALVDRQAGELDPTVRGGMVREASLLLLEEGVRFTPAALAQAWAWWPRVKGLHVNFANREYHFWARVWVE